MGLHPGFSAGGILVLQRGTPPWQQNASSSASAARSCRRSANRPASKLARQVVVGTVWASPQELPPPRAPPEPCTISLRVQHTRQPAACQGRSQRVFQEHFAWDAPKPCTRALRVSANRPTVGTRQAMIGAQRCPFIQGSLCCLFTSKTLGAQVEHTAAHRPGRQPFTARKPARLLVCARNLPSGQRSASASCAPVLPCLPWLCSACRLPGVGQGPACRRALSQNAGPRRAAAAQQPMRCTKGKFCKCNLPASTLCMQSPLLCVIKYSPCSHTSFQWRRPGKRFVGYSRV